MIISNISKISKTHVQNLECRRSLPSLDQEKNLERRRSLPSLDQETKYNDLQSELNQLYSVIKQKSPKQPLLKPSLLPPLSNSPVIKAALDMSPISSIVYNTQIKKSCPLCHKKGDSETVVTWTECNHTIIKVPPFPPLFILD